MCCNCGQANTHSVYQCISYPMSHHVIAMGLQTSSNDPDLCPHCLYPDHTPRYCPLLTASSFSSKSSFKSNKNEQTNQFKKKKKKKQRPY